MTTLQALIDDVQVDAVHRPVALGATVRSGVASRPVVPLLDVVTLRTFVSPASADVVGFVS